jgi:hypothetical protein
MPNADARREYWRTYEPVEKCYAGIVRCWWIGYGSGFSGGRSAGLSRARAERRSPTPQHPLIAAKIILLGDVSGRTILYAVLAVGASDRRT